MLPTFHINNFKPWAPSPRKPFSLHKTSNTCSPRPKNPPHPKPCHGSPPSTLPLPKHHLPPRPPAEVCVHVSANAQPSTTSSPQHQMREVSIPDSEPKTSLEIPGHDAVSPRNLIPHIPVPDSAPCCDPQGSARVSTEPPAFRGDNAEDGFSSPSILNSDDSLEEFFRLPDAQDGIPIDPVILSDHVPIEDIHLQSSIPQFDNLNIPETTYPYPDPPAIVPISPNHYRQSSERDGSENGATQTSDYLHPDACQQVHHIPPDTGPNLPCPNGAEGNNYIRAAKGAKRKAQQSDGRLRKRCRAQSSLPSSEDSFVALRSHFLSLPLNDRLQFLSWLFEGALPRCNSEALPAARGDAQAKIRRSRPPQGVVQNPGTSRHARGSSRKGMPWSTEEVNLLLKLRKEEGRPWTQVARLFSEQYPGRSQGAIQVFFSTTLSKRVD
ncbi:hypothetical protein BDW60DRAFT_170704 [Aspergillus nidulans var. acristatus]